MKKEPFFAQRGDAYIPNPVCNGPWDPNSMHGRVVIGLLAHVIEERHGSADFVPARLTVDMFRLPDIHTPIEVTTRLSATECASGGRGGVLLRRRQHGARLVPVVAPDGKCAGQCVVAAELGRAAAGRDIPAPTDPRLGMNGKWTTRPIVGHMGSLGPRRLWMSEVRELVDGT